MIRKFLFFFIGYVIAAFACFAILYWVFNRGLNHSLEITLQVAGSWMLVELIRSYFKRKKRFHQQKQDASL